MNRRALGIGALVAVLVIVLWYMLLWSPATGDVQEANDRQDQAEQQAAQLRSEIQRLRAAQQNEPAQRARLEALRAGIPEDPNLAQFILDTNDAAVRAGIDFISVAPTPPTAGAPGGAAAAATATTTTTTVAGATGTPTATPPAEIRVNLQIQGGYFQVLDFLNRLDLMPRIVVTDNLTVNADQNGRLSVTIAARMFTGTVPAGFGGPEATTTTTTAPGATTTTTVAGATTTTAPGATTTTSAGAQP